MGNSSPILFLPIDFRPATFRFPEALAKIAGTPLITPPERLDPGKASGWLLSEKVERAVVSIDMLCYGGLFSSRTLETDEKTALRRLSYLRQVATSNRCIVTAFGVLPRLNPVEALAGTFNEQLEFGERIAEWAKTQDAGLAREIGEDHIREYLTMRRRNLEVLFEAVKCVKDGIIRFLGIFLDDTAPEGIHRKEIEQLERKINRSNIRERVAILPGTDEAAMLLTVKSILERGAASPSFFPIFSSSTGANLIGRYEDRPMREVIEQQVGLIGGRICGSREEADILLFVHTPLDRQGEHTLGGQPIFPEGSRERFLENIAEESPESKIVAVADIAYANGADPELLTLLVSRPSFLRRISAYAAWNTAANTLGTVIAHSAARWYFLEEKDSLPEDVRKKAELRHREFLFERILDDGYYQAQIRHTIREERKEAYEKNVPFADKAQELKVRDMLSTIGQKVFDANFRGEKLLDGTTLRNFAITTCRFPLKRTFEIDISVFLS